jgi:FkbM family methyltransferase
MNQTTTPAPNRLRSVTFWLARHVPFLVKPAIWAWLRLYVLLGNRGMSGHQFSQVREVLSFLELRVPVHATLGNGMRVIVPLNDEGGHAMFLNGYYEPDTVKLFERLIDTGAIVFDVGANVGQYTLVASGCVGPAGQVHSFEPEPVTFAWLERNVRLNPVTNVHLNPIALFSERTTMKMYVASVRDTGSNSLVGEPWTYSGQTRDVECVTLDDYMAQHGIDHIDVMKMDIEGAELAALKGAQRLFSGPRPPVFIIEFEEDRQRLAGTSCAELARYLTDRGYALFRAETRPLERYVIGPNEPPSLNVLAIPESRVDTVLARLQ